MVTGASGKAGRAVVRALLERDYDVLAVDVAPPAESAAPFLLADLTEFGQTVECLAGVRPGLRAASRQTPALAESHPVDSTTHAQGETFADSLLS